MKIDFYLDNEKVDYEKLLNRLSDLSNLYINSRIDYDFNNNLYYKGMPVIKKEEEFEEDFIKEEEFKV